MEAIERELDDICFLRPISNARSTNVTVEKPFPRTLRNADLQILSLTDESRKMTMDTLRSIHGKDFQLNDASKYKDLGNAIKSNFWQNGCGLIIQSITTFQTFNDDNKKTPDVDDRLQHYALMKLESYGFAAEHCLEAYKACDGNVDNALSLLYRKYMGITNVKSQENVSTIKMNDTELLEMRSDEKAALQSIYDSIFEEKESNTLWCLKFPIESLLRHKAAADAKNGTTKSKEMKTNTNRRREKARCRNYDKNGKCKFGKNCRFAHLPPITNYTEKSKNEKDELENEKCLHLEIRFPQGTKYPYEAPYIYLKAMCTDVPAAIPLRISRRLYREACNICEDGIPSIFSISELLQMDETIQEALTDKNEPFPDPMESLFAVEQQELLAKMENEAKAFPTHYEIGQTAKDRVYCRDADRSQQENQALVRKFLEQQRRAEYQRMLDVRSKLPAFERMDEILTAINQSQVTVISGETGCGKSTQIPQFILDHWLLQCSQLPSNAKIPHLEIICTQPRRLSAIGVAERVAEERVERVGQTIGYQIRLENKISSCTRLTFCTIGILLRRLIMDPLLQSVSHIIVDEVHERSEESDFLLMLLKDILKKRPEVKVILMSATLNAQLFSDYFQQASMLHIPGRTFPVEQMFLEDFLEVSDFVLEYDSPYCRKVKGFEAEHLNEMEFADVKSGNGAPPSSIKDENLNLTAINARYKDYSAQTCKYIYLMDAMKINPELIESVLNFIITGNHEWPQKGTILVFLPGIQEISVVHKALIQSPVFGPSGGSFIVLPLHSALDNDDQACIFQRAPAGKRKIILSTNIAETSITIDDCVFVIDYGLMKEKHFDTNRNMESLDLGWVSRANALQRKGRAGRVMPGVCIHLYTSHRFYNNFLAEPVPEIHRVPLEQLLLHIKTLPYFEKHNLVDVLNRTLEPPAEENITSAIRRLQAVDALDAEQNLTPLGIHLSALPVDVRLGKLMLFGAIFQCLDSILTIAAYLSNKSPFVCPMNKRAEAQKCKKEYAIYNSDHLAGLIAYQKWLHIAKSNIIAGRQYADTHFLSVKTMETIGDIKYQFLELLVSIGFVPVNVPKKRKNSGDRILELTGENLNVNGGNRRLLIALISAALYPNIVKILRPERTYVQTVGGAIPKVEAAKDLRFKIREGYVSIHPSSVNADVAVYQSPFLVYQEKVKTSRIFIRDCSMVPAVPLVLFAGSDLKIELHGGDFFLVLEDGWIVLKAANHETAEMIQCLRLELLKLLQAKISDPCLNLLYHKNSKKIIDNIVHLITNN